MTTLPQHATLAVDGRGNIFAAFVGEQGITVGEVVNGGVSVLTLLPGSQLLSKVRGFAVDKRGNMVVAYSNGDYLWVSRYNVDGGWVMAIPIDDVDAAYPDFRIQQFGNMEIATADDAGDAMFAWVKKVMPFSPRLEAAYYEFKVVRYDANFGWLTQTCSPRRIRTWRAAIIANGITIGQLSILP